MSIARARFKYALKQCRLEKIIINSSKLAYIIYMQCRDINSFWKDIAIHNKFKCTLSNCIDRTTMEIAIANRWQDHYSSLLRFTREYV